MVGPMALGKGDALELVAFWNPFQLVGGQLAMSSLLVRPGSLVTAKFTWLVADWNAQNNFIVAAFADPPASATFVKGSINTGGVKPKPQAATTANGGVNYTIAGSDVQLRKQMTATIKFRIASNMRSGDKMSFKVEVGGGAPIGLSDTVGVLVK